MKTQRKRDGGLARAGFAVLLAALGGLALARAADDLKPAAADVTRFRDASSVNPAAKAGPDYGEEYVKQSSLLEQFKAMEAENHPLFIQALSATTSDPILNSLIEQELGHETKLAGLKASLGPDAAQMKEETAVIDDLKQKIDLRANGIIAGISIQARALREADKRLEANAKGLGRVYIVGSARFQGPLEIPGDEVLTLSKAILRAGGFGENADRHNVRVTRKPATPGGKDQVFTVNVVEILEKGKTSADLPLEAGDMIFVPDRLVHF
jgi:hypothetical protein